jgi:hypothetical protein
VTDNLIAKLTEEHWGLIDGYGVLAVLCFAAMKLKATELGFAAHAAGAIGSRVGVPGAALLDAAFSAFVVRYVQYAGSAR